MVCDVQPIECKAAIAWGPNKPLEVTTVTIAPPAEGEVRVKVSKVSCFWDDVVKPVRNLDC